jgi:hypothetical protein
MKKKDLEEKFKNIEKSYSNYRVNNTEMFNLQHAANKLCIEIINDFNEKTGLYNIIIMFLTIVIACLTLAMVIKMFIR